MDAVNNNDNSKLKVKKKLRENIEKYYPRVAFLKKLAKPSDEMFVPAGCCDQMSRRFKWDECNGHKIDKTRKNR